MKKILVPTDFSPCAKAAENYALILAKKIDAEIIFLHVKITPGSRVGITEDLQILYPDMVDTINEVDSKLDNLVTNAKKLGLKASKLLFFTPGQEKIYNFIKPEKIDLIVMGSLGQYGFRDHLLGTNTYSMIRRSEIPVMVVKEGYTIQKLNTLVFATNFREESGSTFKRVENLAELLNLKIRVLFVNTPTYFMETNDILKIGKSFLDEFSNYNHEINIHDSFKEEKGIIQFAEKVDGEAIAVITSGKSDLMQYFSPSITENLLAMTEIPILSVKMIK